LNNEDLSASFSALDPHTKVCDHCDPTIGALTHKSSSYKNEIEFTFQHAGTAPQIRLDVTVVRNGGRDTQENPDRAYDWFHDVYDLAVDTLDHPPPPSPPTTTLFCPTPAPTTTTTTPPLLALPNIPDSAGYQLVYELDIPTNPIYQNAAPGYLVNNHSAFSTFSRVAYYLELDGSYVWVSMDAFTDDARKIGVPCLHPTCGDGVTPTVIQQMLSNLNVVSNMPGLTGTNLRGNIEFWPYNYLPGNDISIPGANSESFDFGDTAQSSGYYGSMQVHVNGGGSYVGTVFAFNRFNDGAVADLGIGNRPTSYPDWSLAANANTYTSRKLKIFAFKDYASPTPSPVADSTPHPTAAPTKIPTEAPTKNPSVPKTPTVSPTTVSPTKVPTKTPTKNPTLSPTNAPTKTPTKYPTLSPTKTPTKTPTKRPTLSPTKTPTKTPTMRPTLSPTKTPTKNPTQTPADDIYAVPNIIDSKGYQLAYALDIPVKPHYSLAAPQYSVDNSLSISSFSRIAYYLELNNFYVWVSMDAFTDDARRIGVPCLHLDCGDGVTPTVIQQMVANMNIESNVFGLTGSNLRGNVEFWPYDYLPGNAINIPGASATAFDFGDQVQSHGTFGSMQVHVNGGGSYVGTVFAFNRFNDGTYADLGMSNMPSNLSGLGPDWSLSSNSAAWDVRRLKVFVKNEIPVLPNIPDSAGYQLAYSLDIPTNPKYSLAAPQYSENNSLSILGFSRVAYYLELDGSYVWVSMDAFTDDARKIGVPCLNLSCGNGVTPTVIQQMVSNLNVVSNKPGLTGSNLSGNVEFWPYNYHADNAINIPGASATAFDFGDKVESHGTFGSMQVHVNGGGSYIGTIFAFNRFNDGAVADLGIGNKPSNVSGLGPDWSFTSNAHLYGTKRLRVYVK
jgi:hypothetical protein